jgi:putative glutamine transport system permease protein
MDNAWMNAIQKVFTIKILSFLGQGLLNTLYIAAATIVLSFVFGTILGLLRQSKMPVFSQIAAGYVETVRNIPLTLFIISMRFMTRLPPLESGIAAMTVFTSAIVAEIVRGGLNSVGKGQWEAAYSQGFGWVGSLWYVIVPQAVRRIRSPLVSQFVTTIKDTSFCAVVGTYELSFTSKIAAAHRSMVTAEDIIVIYMTVTVMYYLINLVFATIARHTRENEAKGLVR